MRNRGRHEKYFHPNFSFVPSVALAEFSLLVEINSVVYTFGFCLKTRLSSYPALSRMSIDTGNPLCS